MLDVTLRQATPDDAAAIAPMHLACWHDAYSGLVPRRCLDELDRQDRCGRWRLRLEQPSDVTTIAVCGQQVVGLATVGPLHDEVPLPPEELRSLYVSRPMWGGGLGRALIDRALGDRPASLWVFEGNERARRFYTSCGWTPTGERRLDDWTVIPELRLVCGARQTADDGQPSRCR